MSEPSGPSWCDRFPTSASVDDLLPDFRDRVKAFLSALNKGGAHVSIGATYRPPERAYLMHYCCQVADGSLNPAAIPSMPGVPIDWAHAGAQSAAAAMKSAYAIQYPASLESRHTQRRAIDMTISWNGTLAIRDFDGNMHNIASSPRDGTNAELAKVGASFGVMKLATDPPHWSDDGR